MHLYKINRDYMGPGDNYGGGGDGGLIGALVGAGAQIYDTSQRSKDQKRQNAANKAEAELAYQRQVAMWHQQNAYNSPQQQMERFGAAGLNPHLIYGQGNAGNSSGTPNYQPPDIQMQHVSGRYGAAFSSILPTLMSVGTWMQNMKMTEVDIQKKQSDTERIEQLVGYLENANPKLLEKIDKQNALWPYQRDITAANADRAETEAIRLEQERRYQFGDDGKSGIKQIDFVKKLSEMKLKEAQASWTDYGVTDPQRLVQLVMAGVLGMAGMTMRARGNLRNVNKTEYIGKGQRGRWSMSTRAQKARAAGTDYRAVRVKYGTDYYWKP